MIDRFGRTIDYLRVSVTDRCNLRCSYCMPPGGVPLVAHSDILSFEEIVEVVRTGVWMGIRKVRITGGEPLVRRGIQTLVAMISRIDGVADLAMTTNGTLLAPKAAALKEAGLRRVNISLDSMDPARYAAITAGGDLRDALAGIDAAGRVGLTPVKLNCVIEGSADEPDARGVAEFAAQRGLEVRFIPRMDLATGRFGQVIGGNGGDCGRCSRLRLTSDGFIRPCLMSDLGFSVRQLGPAEAIRRAVEDKPQSGSSCENHWIRRIGG